MMAETPGTISNGIFCRRQRLGLLAAATEDERSPPLSRTTVLPARALAMMAAVMSACGMAML